MRKFVKVPMPILIGGILLFVGMLSIVSYSYLNNSPRVWQTKYCTDLGIKRRIEQKNETEKRNENSQIYVSLSEPRYYYNPRMHACLYRYEISELRFLTGEQAPLRQLNVLDLFTNKTIIYWDSALSAATDSPAAYFQQNRIADLLFQGKTLKEAEEEILDQ